MQKLISLVLAGLLFSTALSVLIHSDGVKLVVMGPYRGTIVIPEEGALALKSGRLIVIDMEAGSGERAEATVNAMMMGQDSRWAPARIFGITW
jgi:hypothetical protein